jgi:hypothetical protein
MNHDAGVAQLVRARRNVQPAEIIVAFICKVAYNKVLNKG